MVDHGRRQKVIGNTQIDRQTSGGSVHTHVDGKEFICFKNINIVYAYVYYKYVATYCINIFFIINMGRPPRA
jgi:hypothetical protein